MAQASLLDQRAGIAARDRGLAAVEINGQDWLMDARRAAIAICAGSGRVTSDQVLKLTGPLPTHLHPNTMGAIFKGSDWTVIGYRMSSRPSRHAARIGIWVYTGKE